MSANQTKKNHFVPKFYFKKFFDNNQQLYLYVLKTKTGYYKSKEQLDEVGFKTNLYTLTIDDKISDEEYKSLKGEMHNEYNIFFLKTLIKFLNGELSDLLRVSSPSDEICDILKKNIAVSLDNDISRNQEILYSMYEDGFQAVYNKIIETQSIDNLIGKSKKEDFQGYMQLKIFHKTSVTILLKFYEHVKKINSSPLSNDIIDISNIKFENNEYFDFIHYLMSQYFRTYKIINSLLNPAKNRNYKPSKGVMSLLIHYNSYNLVYMTLASHKLILLINECNNVDFITSDQPCMNTYSFKPPTTSNNLEEHEFEIYFPLSNKLAILYTRRDAYKDITNIRINDDKDIDGYNRALMQVADRYIYGSSNSVKRIT